MKRGIKQQKERLLFQVLLMLFTLLTLVSCVVAWFSSASTAQVKSILLNVERTEIKLEEDFEITTIEFPCATKIADETTTPNLFNTECAVTKTYHLDYDGDVYTQVTCEGDGMLAYVCDSVNTTDYYTELTARLTEELGTDRSQWTYVNMNQALQTINHRRLGKIEGENTKVKILYWVEFDEAADFLESASYWDSAAENSGNTYKATIVFTD